MTGKARKFLAELAAECRDRHPSMHRKEPASEPAFTLSELGDDAYCNAYDDYHAAWWTACREGEPDRAMFTEEAAEFGWRFTAAGELIENEGEEPA